MNQPSKQSMWRRFREARRRTKVLIGCGSMLVLILALCVCANALPPVPKTANVAAVATATQASTQAPTSKPAPKKPAPALSHYPPKTLADLQALAAKGDTNAMQGFDSESVGLTGACPQPKREVMIDPAITGQQLAEDLLAYFYAQQLDNPCGSIVFAYHTQDEANNGPYTAGRISLDVTDSSGASNVDPNASNLKYQLTLDIGGSDSSQEYVVTYSK